jgi:acetyltransferase
MLLVTTTAEPPAVVAVGEIVSLPTTPSVAEIALVVRDEHQRDGVGSALCQWIGEMAHNWGLHQLQATILAQNHGIRRLLEHLAVPYTASRRRDELQITIDLPHAPSLD